MISAIMKSHLACHGAGSEARLAQGHDLSLICRDKLVSNLELPKVK